MLRFWSQHWHWAVYGLLIGMVAIGVACRPWLKSCLARATGWSSAVPPPSPVFNSAPSVEQIQLLAELVTFRVQVTDILTVEQDGWLNGYKGAWLIRGDALWTTDLQQARIQELRTHSGQPMVRIELTPPTVTWARLDHTKTRTYDLRSKSWIPLMRVPDQVRDEALERAQDLVARAAAQPAYRQQAQRQTEAVLTRFYADAGFATEFVWIGPTPSVAPPAGSIMPKASE